MGKGSAFQNGGNPGFELQRAFLKDFFLFFVGNLTRAQPGFEVGLIKTLIIIVPDLAIFKESIIVVKLAIGYGNGDNLF